MDRRHLLSIGALAALPGHGAFGKEQPPAAILNVLDYGAVADGRTLNTRAIQSAIDSASRRGGATVYVPPGVFLTGGVVLRSRVTLHLEAGAVLRGSAELADYAYQAGPPEKGDANGRHLIFARGAEDLAITGLGIIDGQGSQYWESTQRPAPAQEDLWKDVATYDWKPKLRPSPMLEFAYCKNLRIEGVTIANAPGWTMRPIACESVFIRGIRVRNPVIGPNTDGMDVTCCRNVFISDCDIATGDDAICIKSENPYGEMLPTKNITITNCVLTGCCNGFKMGTATRGAFENIVFSNSVIYNDDVPPNARIIAGLAVEMVDGGSVDGILFSNIRMQNVRTPVFVRLGHRHDSEKTFLRNVRFEGIEASGSILTSSITGVPGCPVEEISLENVRIRTVEGGSSKWAEESVPEVEQRYPEARMFGRLPGYGLYVRHAKGVQLRNAELIAERPDERPALVCDDVEDLTVDALRGTLAASREPFLALHNTRDAFIYNSQPPKQTSVFLRVSGDNSGRIVLAGNNLGRAGQRFELRDGAAPDSVMTVGD
jgi:hypothetical protein